MVTGIELDIMMIKGHECEDAGPVVVNSTSPAACSSIMTCHPSGVCYCTPTSISSVRGSSDTGKAPGFVIQTVLATEGLKAYLNRLRVFGMPLRVKVPVKTKSPLPRQERSCSPPNPLALT